jgi:hypothetical protein
MMLDFAALTEKRISYAEMIAGLTPDDLADLTNEMVDAMLAEIEEATDADVIFVPHDPNADDPFAATDTEKDISWTLGHVVVHTTASSEEAAFLAAELARGVENHGRSRAEVPWEGVTTIAQCRHRLEESRRMRLASLAMWPDQPDLENGYHPWPSAPHMNAIGRFVSGLAHDWDHLGQIRQIMQQVRAA